MSETLTILVSREEGYRLKRSNESENGRRIAEDADLELDEEEARRFVQAHH